ncbi:hypothetical protein K503DRAFT_171314 [Rhizopogon vinicolor AM-OR11-026]|uniref:Uncharacterized protein n=1 Tax=Rhizopogon vinicolor AM-OR11-026 TaxID=1314800 RepID=A0A1B7N0A1_9AGAM|nr:hypothetical protein K503DRAFT_171314 [Rhizopogon vinicolor AM-OR11-026]
MIVALTGIALENCLPSIYGLPLCRVQEIETKTCVTTLDNCAIILKVQLHISRNNLPSLNCMMVAYSRSLFFQHRNSFLVAIC